MKSIQLYQYESKHIEVGSFLDQDLLLQQSTQGSQNELRQERVARRRHKRRSGAAMRLPMEGIDGGKGGDDEMNGGFVRLLVFPFFFE